MSNTHTTENNRYLNQLAHKHDKIRQLEGHLKNEQELRVKWMREFDRLNYDVHRLKCLNGIMSNFLFNMMDEVRDQPAEKTQDDIESLFELSDVITKMAKESYEGQEGE